MRLNSIRTRTLAVLILICVAIVFILGGLWLYTTSQNIRSGVLTAGAHDSDIMADYVRVYVETVEASVVTVSGDPKTAGAIRLKNFTNAGVVLGSLVGATQQDDVAFMIDPAGGLLFSTCSTATPPLDAELREVVARSKNATYVTDEFYSDELDGYAFAVVSPVRDNGTVIGYVYDAVRPSDLYAFMAREKTYREHSIILVDRQGRVIIHDNRSIMDARPDLSSSLPVMKALRGESGVVEHPGMFDGKPCISAYHPIPDIGWGLVISTRADVPYRQLEGHLVRIVTVCLLFILALAVFGYFASRYLIDPIERLSATMARVSGGDYDAGLRAARDDEIGDLERDFNSLVAEIKKRDERIRSEKDRSEFYLDLISHDINNMNHAGMGYLEMAIGDLAGAISTDDLGLLEKAYDSLKNSSGLIDNVRKIKRVHASRLAPEVVDMGLMLSGIEKKYASVPGRDVSIRYAPSESCRVQACSLFGEVLENIVGNAIKHSDPAKPLVIGMGLLRTTVNGKDYCKVSIEDNGPGVPDGMKAAIFTRLQQGDTPARGRGLGLYIVRMLVEEYGGSVYVEDRVRGDHTRGARFVILMPAAEKENSSIPPK